jgi:hypothetical protein
MATICLIELEKSRNIRLIFLQPKTPIFLKKRIELPHTPREISYKKQILTFYQYVTGYFIYSFTYGCISDLSAEF